MDDRLRPSLKHYRAKALTLIEVLAALAILSIVLASLLIARARAMCQSTLAAEKLEICEAARQQIAQWIANPESLPRPAIGDLDKKGSLHHSATWTSYVRPIAEAALGSRAEIVTITFQTKSSPTRQLLTVELLLPRRVDEAK